MSGLLFGHPFGYLSFLHAFLRSSSKSVVNNDSEQALIPRQPLKDSTVIASL